MFLQSYGSNALISMKQGCTREKICLNTEVDLTMINWRLSLRLTPPPKKKKSLCLIEPPPPNHPLDHAITTKFYFSSRHHTINSEQFRITPINLDLPWIFTTVLAEKTLYTNTLYTNTDLKISLYVLIHIKIISWKCFILNPKNYRVIHP